MDKMQMAHDMALAMAADGNVPNENIVAIVWQYADAMQAEADNRNNTERPKVLFELKHVDEWQPDWSQAPEWAKWWAMDADEECYWFENKPQIMSVTWLPFDSSNVDRAPSFDYQGNWQDSLRKRPE